MEQMNFLKTVKSTDIYIYIISHSNEAEDIHYKKKWNILTDFSTAEKFVRIFWRIYDWIPTKCLFFQLSVFRRKCPMKLWQNKRCRKISMQFRPQSEKNIYPLRDLFRCFEFFVFVGISSVYTDKIPTEII